MAQRRKARHVGNLRERIFVLAYQFGGTVELVGLEENRRGLARETFHFIVELGARHVYQTRYFVHIKLAVGKFFLHKPVKLLQERAVLDRQYIGFDIVDRRSGINHLPRLLPVPQQRAYLRNQQSGVERFCQIGVSLSLKSEHLALDSRFGRKKYYRDMAETDIALHRLAKFVPVLARHH